MWLNDFGLDIRCVRMHPYISNGETLLDVQTVIPIPEAADYQVKIREKKQRERASRTNSKDLTKFDVFFDGKKAYQAQSKRWMMFYIISHILRSGIVPEKIADVVAPWKKSHLFEVFEGTLDTEQFYEAIMKDDPGGKIPRSKRYFIDEEELFCSDEKTYAITKGWGKETAEVVKALSETFPNLKIEIKPTERED